MGDEFIYKSYKSSLEPSYTGYQVNSANLGMAVDPRTAMQIQEFSSKLSSGTKTLEVGNIQPNVFESIPKEQLKEIYALSKLTGTEATLHAPLIEASGFTREGGWTEGNRQQAERQMLFALQRAHDLNPKGNVPVTFHSTVNLPEAEEKVKVDGKEISVSMIIVDPRTGKMAPIKEQKRYFPEGGGAERERFNPQKELEKINNDMWIESVNNINQYAIRGEETVRQVLRDFENLPEAMEQRGLAKEDLKKLRESFLDIYSLAKKKPEEFDKLPDDAKKMLQDQFRNLEHASIFLRDSYRGLKELYNTAYYAVENERNEAKKQEEKAKLDKYRKVVEERLKDVKDLEDPRNLKEFTEVIEEGIKVLGSVKPISYKPLNEFMIEKSAESFGNIAWESYKNLKNNAPIIAIENPPAGGGLSRAEDLRKLIEESQAKFIEHAKKAGMNEKEAKEQAMKLIGATWDVGHINMIRKFGYDKVDLVKQAEIIKPFVKKIHLSDNFGLEHTELPMGMGNVPLKEIMEKLGKEGYDAKKIVEAGDWWQHMKTNPFVPSLEGMGANVYGTQTPYWNQGSYGVGNYFAGYGTQLPEQHFSMYGSGFSSLPGELGGQVQKKQGFAGAPMD